MSGIDGAGGAMSIDRILAMRAQILERNAALSRANQSAGAAPAAPTRFVETFEAAFAEVNRAQHQAGALSEAYERGETIDIAKVMLARQEASVGFEATLQVRNKILSAYKDIMSMPV